MANMFSRRSPLQFCILLLVTSAVPALSASLEKPETFVRRIYAHYQHDGPGIPMGRPTGTPFYTAALLDAVSAAEEATIDWDPICGCQAWDNVRIKSVVMTGEPADTVKARVVFANLGSMQTATLTLSRTPVGWRIADVSEKGVKSIMALLRNAEAHPSQPARPSGAEKTPPKP